MPASPYVEMIDTESLSQTALRLVLPIAEARMFERLGDEAEFQPQGDGEARLELLRDDVAVTVRGEAQVRVLAHCSRCLVPVRHPLTCRVSHRLVLPEFAGSLVAPSEAEDACKTNARGADVGRGGPRGRGKPGGGDRGAEGKGPSEPIVVADLAELTDSTVTRVLKGRHLDPLELVGEDLVMALPLRALCRSRCRGLCGSCGTNLNTHPCACAPAGRALPLAELAHIKLRQPAKS